MEAEPVDPGPGGDSAVCAEVDEHIGGPGGIWLEQEGDVVLPPPSGRGQGAPTPSPAPLAPPADGGASATRACVVPKLAGKRPARAKAALRRAGCRPGRVWMRRGLKRRLRRHAKLRRRLVVKASRPRAGARPAGGRVHLRLGPKPRKVHRKPRNREFVAGAALLPK